MAHINAGNTSRVDVELVAGYSLLVLALVISNIVGAVSDTAALAGLALGLAAALIGGKRVRPTP